MSVKIKVDVKAGFHLQCILTDAFYYSVFAGYEVQLSLTAKAEIQAKAEVSLVAGLLYDSRHSGFYKSLSWNADAKIGAVTGEASAEATVYLQPTIKMTIRQQSL